MAEDKQQVVVEALMVDGRRLFCLRHAHNTLIGSMIYAIVYAVCLILVKLTSATTPEGSVLCIKRLHQPHPHHIPFEQSERLRVATFL